MTPLDALCTQPFHEADAPARAAILRRLADTMLFVALAEEAGEDRLRLLRLDGPDGPLVLGCDTDDRLTDFLGQAVDYAALAGRVVAGMLARDGLALLVNPGTRSEMLIAPDALRWLVDALAESPDAAQDGADLSPPGADLPENFVPLLGERLAEMAGLASAAILTQARWADGREGYLLLIEGARPEFEPAIAKAIGEFAAFLPPLPGGLDVSFAPLAAPKGAPRIVIEPAPIPPPPPPRKAGPPILR